MTLKRTYPDYGGDFGRRWFLRWSCEGGLAIWRRAGLRVFLGVQGKFEPKHLSPKP